MDHSSPSVLADAASDVLITKKRVASNRVLSKCAECDKSWPTALALEDHAKEAHHEAWVCSVAGCEVGFTNRSAFSKHKSKHNSANSGHPCPDCGHKFHRRDNLFEHRAIQGRCKSSLSREVAQCSPDRSKRRRLNNPVQPPGAEVLNNSFTTAGATLQQPQLHSPIEHGDHSWPQILIEPVVDTGSRVSSINHFQAWEDPYMPVNEQSSTGRFERSSFGSATSNANAHLFYLKPGHAVFQHVGEPMHTSTTNNAILCQGIDHADGNISDDHDSLPEKASDAATVVSFPSHDPIDEGLLSSNEPEMNVDPPPAETDFIELPQDIPWLKWLQERREKFKSGDGDGSWFCNTMYSRHATEVQTILEVALWYHRGSQQDLQDIMSNLSITDLLEPNEQLEQTPGRPSFEAAIRECRTALIPDLPTLCSFFGRDLAVGTGPHQALWSFAVRFGQNEIVELLLEKGAHPDQKILGANTSDRIPLIVACYPGNWDLAKSLLEKGANPNVCNNEGWSVLYIAAGYGKLEMVKLLLEEQADPNLSGQSKAHFPLLSAISCGSIDLVELLLQHGADVNIEGYEYRFHDGKSHCTPLLLAITKNHIGMVDLLLTKRANPDGHGYYVPLLVAVGIGCTEMVESLLDKGADVNMKGYDVAFRGDVKSQFTPLMLAIAKKHDRITNLLLEKGADVNLNCENRSSYPLSMALSRGEPDIVERLLDKGADVNIIVSMSYSYGRMEGTPLLFATWKRNAGMVKVSLQGGADPNFDMEDDKYSTSLVEAVYRGETEIVKLLIDYGAHVNARSPDSAWDKDEYTTPVCAAIRWNRWNGDQRNEIAKTLLDHGADPNIPASDGSDVTPLYAAMQYGDVDMVRLLLAKNARVEPGIERCMRGWYGADPYDNQDNRTKLKLIEEARLKQDSSDKASLPTHTNVLL